MKRLIYLLLLLFTLSVDAAITVTNRGGASSASSSTSQAFSPTATIAVNHIGVVVIAVDNLGASGSTKIAPQSPFTDSVGNTWTMRVSAIYNPAGVGSGVEIAAYTAPITTQITTSDSVTITYSVSATGRSIRLLDVAGATNVYFVTAAPISDLLTSGQTGTAVSMTTGSIPNGDVVICWSGAEGNTGSTTGDSDTTNGSWSANLTLTNTSPMRLDEQHKIVTGTGTQSYDITLGSSVDWETGWLQLSETNPSPPTQSSTNGFF